MATPTSPGDPQGTGSHVVGAPGRGVSSSHRSRRWRRQLVAVGGTTILACAGLAGPASASAPAPAPAPALLADPACPGTTSPITCSFTGGAQSWTVPAGVTQATFVVSGAQGNAGETGGSGGDGGQATATINVVPGTTYQINVGGAGVPAAGGAGGFGGFNGGANGGDAGFAGGGGGGGGASDIRTGADGLADRVVVAGGGGGGGCGITGSSTGGAGGTGGGSAGGTGGAATGGSAGSSNGGGGGGGTQVGGGPGAQLLGGSGSLGSGGTGGATGGANCSGGGGGGGYYGGGGGGAGLGNGGGGGGGGGSGFGPAGTTFGTSPLTGNGQVTITYTTREPVTTHLFALPPRARVGVPVVIDDVVCPATAGATTVPTGTVTFTDITTGTNLGTIPLVLTIGNCAATGRVTAFRTPGPHVITAVYSGDSVYQGNSANPETLTVTVTP